MNNDPNKRQVPVTYRHSGETRMSEPVPVHAPRQDADAVAPTAPVSTSAQDLLAAVEPRDEQAGAQGPSDAAPLSPSPASAQKATGAGKAKVDIETLEQFIEYAYSRKGQRISLKPKVEKAIAQNPRLDDGALSRLLLLAEGDVLLAVPRQILLISRDIEGYPALRASLGSFVATVMQRHPAFADSGLQAALRNLPDAPSPADALAHVMSHAPAEREGSDPMKGADLQALRQNAANLFVTWLANSRSMNPDEVSALLFQVVWLPAARELADDGARIRALTELDKAAGVGLACMRFRQQAIDASTSQEKALRDANALRLQLAETEGQRSVAQEQRDALQAELEALRERTAAEMAELRRIHVAERTHLHHGQEQLGGRLVRRLDDAVETLEVGLSALRNKTPRVEVMLERAELVVDALRAEIKNLREE